MSDRAYVNGVLVKLPVPAAVWKTIASASIAGLVTLPCCRERGYARISSCGMQHFGHQNDDGCRGISPEHKAAQQQIGDACRVLGLTTRNEYSKSNSNWRADVHAEDGEWKCCFEVQTSPQSLDDTIARQLDYSQSGVPCYWFFKKPPKGQLVGHPAALPSVSQFSTPIFPLNEHLDYPPDGLLLHEVPLRDVFSWQRAPLLGDFVRSLLTHQVSYRSSLPVWASGTVKLWTARCTYCRDHGRAKQNVPFFALAHLHASMPCGITVQIERASNALLFPVHHAHILSPFEAALGENGIDFSLQDHVDGRCKEFVCPRCGQNPISVMPHWKPNEVRYRGQLSLTADHIPFPLGHWCDSTKCNSLPGGNASELPRIPFESSISWKPRGKL